MTVASLNNVAEAAATSTATASAGDKYTILVTLFEGRYFQKSPSNEVPADVAAADPSTAHHSSKIYLQCRFNNEILTTDPVPYSADPIWDTELAWQLDARTLRYLRTQRAMLKLQCFSLNARQERELVGYLMLDLRQAQDFPAKERWLPLVHLKTVGFRPEIRLAFGLGVEGSALPTTIPVALPAPRSTVSRPVSVVQGKKRGKQAAVKTAPVQASSAVVQKVLSQLPKRAATTIPVKMTDAGFYQIGEGKTFFLYTIAITYAGHLQALVANAGAATGTTSGYYFYFNIFGSVIVTEPFFDLHQPTFTGERVLIRIRSSAAELQQFYRELVSMPVFLCRDDDVLGHTEIPVDSCFQTLDRDRIMVEATYPLLDNDSVSPLQHDMQFPSAVVGVTMSLEQELSVASAAPPVNYSTGSPKKHVLPSKGSVPTAATSQDRAGISVPPTWHQFRLAIDLRSLLSFRQSLDGVFCKYSYAPLTGPDSAFTASSTPIGSDATGKVGTIVTYPACHVYADHENLLPHSFCAFEFLMDPARFSTYLESLPLLVEVWARSTTVDDGTGSQAQDDVKIGTATVLMDSLLKSKPETVPGMGPAAMRKRVEKTADVYSDHGKDKVGDLKIVLVMEDFGVRSEEDNLTGRAMVVEPIDMDFQMACESHPVRVGAVASTTGHHQHQLPARPASTKPMLGEARPPPSRAVMSFNKSGKPINMRQSLEYKAAIDLETWKQSERDKFERKLKDKEATMMLELTQQWKVRETERESAVQTKVAELQKLEGKATAMLKQLEERERAYHREEQEYRRKQTELESELDRRIVEARDNARRLTEEFAHEVKLEKLKTEELEKQKQRLIDERKDLETRHRQLEQDFHQYRQTALRTSRMRSKSQPSEAYLRSEVDQLHAEKQRLEEEISAADKSKKYYKQAWMKAMKDMSDFRRAAEDEGRERIEREQRELDHMRMRYLEREEQELVAAALDTVPVTAAPKMNKSNVAAPAVSSDPSRKEEVARLLKEKEVLMHTGVYSAEDKLVKLLDEKIAAMQMQG